ncbi:hypothetical protein Hypma_014878 [Hypsizygus marmoreus]|uniref:Uncharacterized protein n=1 Tax=Hypsizygus marmoreus TaxID=39966 RepID=A0A369K9E3_HYPMA|nr:hypothetical protein Hypma_014878 [Hypsizygus marmoreus]
MATNGPQLQPAAQLCDYCHQKPKFSNHQYCSKTCASQAGSASNNMCIQCHKKPKFQNFDFCGKSCASQANPQRRNATGGGQRGKGSNAQQPAQPAFGAMQVAQFVAQQVPHVKALLAAMNAVQPPQQPAVAPVTQPQVQPAGPQNNPFLQPNPFVQPQMQAQPQMNGTPASGLSNSLGTAQHPLSSAQPPADPPECLIPGCGKPVHVDAQGMKTSDYCSKRHREEAVESGVAEPCILCLTLPQSEKDYFCSRACREEAMKKLPE